MYRKSEKIEQLIREAILAENPNLTNIRDYEKIDETEYEITYHVNYTEIFKGYRGPETGQVTINKSFL